MKDISDLRPIEGDFIGNIQKLRLMFDEADGDFAKQQEICTFALGQVWLFVSQSLPQHIRADLLPVLSLISAMEGLIHGINHPLLKNYSQTPGARPLSYSDLFIQAVGIGMAEILIEAGFKESDANKEAALLLANEGALGSRSKLPVTPGMVRAWRAKANSGDQPKLRSFADYFISSVRRGFEAMNEWPPRRSEAAHLIKFTVQQPFVRAMIRPKIAD